MSASSNPDTPAGQVRGLQIRRIGIVGLASVHP
jgi:hypothetical protein